MLPAPVATRQNLWSIICERLPSPNNRIGWAVNGGGSALISSNNQEKNNLDKLSEYSKRWPGLYVRDGNRIVEVSPRDSAIARNYAYFLNKGPVVSGRRITVFTESTTYRLGEEVRVIHVVEFTGPGYQAYGMRPKCVYGEHINDKLVTEPWPVGDPLVPSEYNGVTLPSPVVDYDFEITSYIFNEPGTYWIQWRLRDLKSNTLVVTIDPHRVKT
jgi:hypothetical protein